MRTQLFLCNRLLGVDVDPQKDVRGVLVGELVVLGRDGLRANGQAGVDRVNMQGAALEKWTSFALPVARERE